MFRDIGSRVSINMLVTSWMIRVKILILASSIMMMSSQLSCRMFNSKMMMKVVSILPKLSPPFHLLQTPISQMKIKLHRLLLNWVFQCRQNFCKWATMKQFQVLWQRLRSVWARLKLRLLPLSDENNSEISLINKNG